MGVAETAVPSSEHDTIIVRKFDPEALKAAPEYFFDNDPFKTHFLNSLSVLFPEGERFFIRSVLAYRDELDDPQLLADIKAFSGQEAQHALVHEAMNDLAARHGYPVHKLEEFNRKILRWISHRGKKHAYSRRMALAGTACTEHVTAILAYQLLTHGDVLLKGLDPAVKVLFEWHALEETEHKAVAFDVYQATGGSALVLRLMMLWASASFVFGALAGTAVLLSKDGNIKKWSTWKSGARYLFGPRQGFFVRPLRDWLAFFKPGFHPSKQHQDIDLQRTTTAIAAYVG